MEYSSLTPKQKSDYFDLVNSIHLKLKGKPKNDLRRNMKNSWKNDSNIMLIFMKLYESFDVYEKMEESEHYTTNPKVGAKNNDDYLKKPVTTRQHLLHVAYLQDEIDNLEQQLENIESGKGYLKLEDHETKIQETKDFFRQENASLKDQMIKYKNLYENDHHKMESMEQTHRKLMEAKDKTIKCLEHDLFEDKK